MTDEDLKVPRSFCVQSSSVLQNNMLLKIKTDVPMVYNRAKQTMSVRRSTYVFDRYENYDDAKTHLYKAFGSEYSNSDCIYDYGSWGSDCWRIDIYSDCSDAPLAADIMREHRGKYYDVN